MDQTTINEAMDRVRDAMAKHTKDPALTAIGEYITTILLRYPEESKKVKNKPYINHGDILTKALESMRDYASKNRQGTSYAFVGPAQAAKIIDDYFGFTHGGAWAFTGAAPDTEETEAADQQAEDPGEDIRQPEAEPDPLATAPEEMSTSELGAAAPQEEPTPDPDPQPVPDPEQEQKEPEAKPQTSAFMLPDLDDLLAGL